LSADGATFDLRQAIAYVQEAAASLSDASTS
jgi:hypothetical protein